MALTMCKDHQAVYEVCLDEWSDILKSHPRFANWMEDVDAYICNTADLAAMIDHAPTLTVRHVLREAVYCRQQLADRMGNQFATNVEEQATFDRVTAEWHSALIVHPAFASWLATIDRFNCERTILIEAMQRAPSQEIRQALRETYCFRETTSLISGRPFI